jgi:hypothetical protein
MRAYHPEGLSDENDFFNDFLAALHILAANRLPNASTAILSC